MRLDEKYYDDCGDILVTATMATEIGLTACDIQRMLRPSAWEDLATWHDQDGVALFARRFKLGLPVLLGGEDEEEGACCVRLPDFEGFPVFLVDLGFHGLADRRAVPVVVLGVGRGAPYIGVAPVGH
jgi:hypothetical protein